MGCVRVPTSHFECMGMGVLYLETLSDLVCLDRYPYPSWHFQYLSNLENIFWPLQIQKIVSSLCKSGEIFSGLFQIFLGPLQIYGEFGREGFPDVYCSLLAPGPRNDFNFQFFVITTFARLSVGSGRTVS